MIKSGENISGPWVFLLLCIHGGHGLTSFPDNLVVGKSEGSVTLNCPKELKGEVKWKYERGEDVYTLDENDYDMEGHSLTLSDLGGPMLGEYSCWGQDGKLSSSYVRLDAEEEEADTTESHLSCRARSYNCSFTCTWNNSEVTALRLGLGPDCLEGKPSCPWVSPDNGESKGLEGGYTFTLLHPFSASSEESTALLVTAEAIDDRSYFRETKQFYLRDIVQPDSPQDVKFRVEKQMLKVTVEPAPTWTTPRSFYPLEHEIEYRKKDDGKVERSTTGLIPREVSELRVRSRDPFVLSTWSQWSPWKNVPLKRKEKKKRICCKNKKKKCRRRHFCHNLAHDNALLVPIAMADN
ncbi:interleukin-12 subunit beta [Osmerus mordax]|uniref:interleukin-12 subunit beta n=1 Tax=Osmerus mordax TaxID=8014 RepID=UPI0035102201